MDMPHICKERVDIDHIAIAFGPYQRADPFFYPKISFPWNHDSIELFFLKNQQQNHDYAYVVCLDKINNGIMIPF